METIITEYTPTIEQIEKIIDKEYFKEETLYHIDDIWTDLLCEKDHTFESFLDSLLKAKKEGFFKNELDAAEYLFIYKELAEKILKEERRQHQYLPFEVNIDTISLANKVWNRQLYIKNNEYLMEHVQDFFIAKEVKKLKELSEKYKALIDLH